MNSDAEEKNNAQQEHLLVQRAITSTKSALLTLTLPCGYLDSGHVLHREIVIREMTGKEEDLLSSKSTWLKKSNELFIQCIERLGTLTSKEQIAAAVPELLIGDRTFLFFAIRRASLGNEYTFREQCPHCKRESVFTADLSELTIQEMADPTKRHYEGVIPGPEKLTYRFHLLKGADQAKLEDFEDNKRRLTHVLLFQLDLLDGRTPTVDAVQSLTTRQRDYLRSAFAKVDGGVDTEMTLACPKCNEDFHKDIDLGPGFFFPSAMQKISKKKSSS